MTRLRRNASIWMAFCSHFGQRNQWHALLARVKKTIIDLRSGTKGIRVRWLALKFMERIALFGAKSVLSLISIKHPNCNASVRHWRMNHGLAIFLLVRGILLDSIVELAKQTSTYGDPAFLFPLSLVYRFLYLTRGGNCILLYSRGEVHKKHDIGDSLFQCNFTDRVCYSVWEIDFLTVTFTFNCCCPRRMSPRKLGCNPVETRQVEGWLFPFEHKNCLSVFLHYCPSNN